MSDQRTARGSAQSGGKSDSEGAHGGGEAAQLRAWREHRPVSDLLAGLSLALGDKLRAVVLYGPAARLDRPSTGDDLHLLVVVSALDLETLGAAGPSLERWLASGNAMPRLFTPETLRAAADVFPIELGEIAERHLVLRGRDPLAGAPLLDPEYLRLQCERELREKMMRLQEAYALSRGREADVARLIVSSYRTFALVFRGCLRLLGERAPDSDLAAAEAFCRRAGVDPGPFTDADRLRRGEKAGSARDLFARYYAALGQALDAMDRFAPESR
jgi:hypothetical protein